MMRTTFAESLAALDAIPMRQQFVLAYRAERASLHRREEAGELQRRSYSRTTYRATNAALHAIASRIAAENEHQTTAPERLAARRERDSLRALFTGTKKD